MNEFEAREDVDRKQQILSEIDGVRADLSSSPKIKLRAQADRMLR